MFIVLRNDVIVLIDKTIAKTGFIEFLECFQFRLGYATSSDVIEMKGRVACEISRFVFLRLFTVIFYVECLTYQ